jgi:hypothetical protein
VQVWIQDFEVPAPGKLVNLVFLKRFDETTPNCSKPPPRWWELRAFKFWPSYFRATAVFISLMFEHDGMPCTAVNYSVGCEISKTHANLPSQGSKITGLCLIFFTAVEYEFSKLYFLPQLVFILLSTFVNILNLARPYISNLAAAGSSWQICRDHPLVTKLN